MAHKKQQCQIVVIADPEALDGDRYRHCFWPYLVPEKKLNVCAIKEKPTANSLYGKTRLLVVNWDAANGDPVSDSDTTLLYLETQARVRIHELMSRGATVFAECQTAQGVPVQKAYNAIFGDGQMRVTTEVPPETERRGETATVARKYAEHPVLIGIPTQVKQHYQPRNERLIYDRLKGKEPDAGRIFDRYKRSLWFGWFTWWAPGWVPLLYADLPQSYVRKNGRKVDPAPVLLAKVEKNGLLLASTLWASGACCEDLIKNIIDVRLDDVKVLHKKILRKKVVTDLAFGVTVAATLVVILRFLSELAFSPSDSGFTWAFSVGGVGFVSICIAAWNTFMSVVWKRPLGISIAKSAVRCLKNRLFTNGRLP